MADMSWNKNNKNTLLAGQLVNKKQKKATKSLLQASKQEG